MLYANDAGVVSRLPKKLRKMMQSLFTHEGDAEGHHHIQRRGSRSDVQLNERVPIPERTSTTTPICPSRSTDA